MIIRPATTQEIDTWDSSIVRNPDGGNVFQSKALAETKRRGGWRPQYLIIGTHVVTILEKSVPFLGRYWYIPKGPGMTSAPDILTTVAALRTYASSQGVFAIKVEPELLESPEARNTLEAAGLVHTPAIQPNVSTVIIDLSPPLDDIMANFNQKGRHAVHRAERDGVTARPVEMSEENMRIMFDLLISTASGRFDSSLRSYDYYKAFWRNFASGGRGSLFFAYYQGRVVASAFCMYLGRKGLYKDGASIREKTAYGASHLLQWEAIKWMKERGVESYDLCGAPHSSRVSDESGSFYGIGRFKTSFNKRITDYVGCYDIIARPLAYQLWRHGIQRIVISLTYRLKHDQWF